MKSSERLRLLNELQQIQIESEAVEVTVDFEREIAASAQARVDEIERMLAADTAARIPPAELEE